MSNRLDVSAGAQTTAFRTFYVEQYTPTVRLARFLARDPAIAEDLAQEAFLRLHDRFGQVANPGGYLRMTLVNVCRNQHRSVVREQVRLVRHGPNPTQISDRAAELDASLRRLSYDERAVIVLRYWLDLTEAQIAEHLGCRPGTVKSRHARALRKIHKDLT